MGPEHWIQHGEFTFGEKKSFFSKKERKEKVSFSLALAQCVFRQVVLLSEARSDSPWK